MSRATAGFTVHHNLRRKLGRSVALLWQAIGAQSLGAVLADGGSRKGQGRPPAGAQVPMPEPQARPASHALDQAMLLIMMASNLLDGCRGSRRSRILATQMAATPSHTRLAGGAERERWASDGKARAAAARSGCVGIVDFEGGANEVVDKIDLGTSEIFERNGVDQYARTSALDHEIVRFRGGNEIKLVGEAGTAPALHAHAQKGGIGFTRGDLGDALGSAL